MKKINVLLFILLSFQSKAQTVTDIYQQKCRPPVSLGGARSDTGIVYIIDGVAVRSAQLLLCTSTVVPLCVVSPSHYTFTREELARFPTNNLQDVISTLPGTYQQRRGDEVSIYGGGPNGTRYVMDGVVLHRW